MTNTVTDTVSPVITTQYYGATDSTGSRIRATLASTKKSVVWKWDHALSVVENHDRAALALMQKLSDTVTPGKWARGDTLSGYCYIRYAIH